MIENNVKYQVEYIQEQYGEGSPWAVVYTRVENGQSVSTTLITDAMVYDYFINTYGRYTCRNMWDKFLAYNDMRAHDLYLAQEAYYAEYNPIDNYNGETERITTKDDGDETHTHKTGGDGGAHKTVTTLAADGTYTEHATTTDDSISYRNESKDTTNGGTVTTDDLHTEDKTTHTATAKTINAVEYTGDEIHHEIERKHGNLGITTTQSMITDEVSLRMTPVNKIYLDTFIREYAYYVGGSPEYCGVII